MNDSYPIPELGRCSEGMDTVDWQQLACAYDTWNDCLEFAREAGLSQVDPDLFEFVKDVFSEQGLWDHRVGEPMLEQYRLLIYNRC